MFYLGHFLFETDETVDSAFGYFTCLAEAVDIDEAMDKFEKQITSRVEETDLFDDIRYIYLLDVIEFSSLPENGILGRFELFEGELPPSTNITLPYDKEIQGCAFYRPQSDDEDEESDEDIIIPFMELDN
jgi:hypothetical protein